MVEKTLNDLFLAHLKDIYYAEKKIYRTLPKMAKATTAPELKQAFMTHREETQGQIERLEQVFEMIGKRAQGKPCEAINGIVTEGEETIEDFGESAAIDAGLVAAGQAVEHYEMARYGALIAEAIDSIVFIKGRGTARRIETVSEVTGLDADGDYAVSDFDPHRQNTY